MSKSSLGYLVVALLIVIPIFGHLDRLPILEWDESRLAMNSYEMLRQPDNILVPTFDEQPDMWNTKPPFLIWLQALSMKLLGINEIAVRLPSAIAAGILCLFLYWVVGIKFRRPWLGIITCAVLVTSEGYVSTHGTRTGDYDSMLTMFTTMYGMLFFLFFEQGRLKYLYMAFACLVLGVLTKGIAAMFFTPAIFIYIFTRRGQLSIFKNVHVYMGLLLFLLVSLGYYFLREQYNPGYLKAVYENELGGRFAQVNEQHVGPWNYYLELMIEWRFKYSIFALPLGLIAGLRSKSAKLRRLTIYSSLLSAFFFTVISTAQTKLDWYDTPLYPWVSFITALFIYTVFRSLRLTVTLTKGPTLLLPVLFLLFVFLVPYRNIYYSVTAPKIDDWGVENMNMGYMLKHAKEGKVNIEGYHLVWDDYAPNLHWYLKVYKEKLKVRHLYSNQIKDETRPGDTIAIYKTGTRQYVEGQNHPITQVGSYYGVVLYERK